MRRFFKEMTQLLRVNNLRNGVMKLIHSGFFHIFGSNTINHLIQFSHGVLIIRVIPKAEYGVYGFAANIYQFFLMFSGFGVLDAILQVSSESANDPDKSENYFQFGYRFGLAFNVLLSMVILAFSQLVPLSMPGSNQLLALMCFLPLPMFIKSMQAIYLQVNLRNVTYGKMNTIDALVSSIFTILGALLLRAQGIVLSQYLAISLVVMILWWGFKVPFLKKDWYLTKSEKRDTLKLASVSILSNSLSKLLYLLGPIVLGVVMADESISASYKVAATIPLALDVLPASLTVFIYPHFARNRNNRAWVIRTYKQVLLFAGLGTLGIALGGIILAEPIIRILFGQDYLDSVPPFRILLMSFFFGGTLRTVAGNLLVTQRRLKFNLVLSALSAIISMTTSALLIPRLAAPGAALAQLITVVFTGAISTAYFIYVIHNLPVTTSNEQPAG